MLAIRRIDQIQSPQFWAEDGSVFFLQARTLGDAALWTPSAGYYHTLLRVVAWLAARVDVGLVPAFYVAAAALLTLYVAARTQSSRFPLGASSLFALAVVVIPDGYEVLLNLTNVQWILAAGLMLLLISGEPCGLWQRVHDVAALVLLGLTGPFILVFGPLFLWRAWQRRTAFSVTLAALAVGCGAIQLSAIVASQAMNPARVIQAQLLLAIPGTRVGGSLFSGGELDAEVPRMVNTLAGGVVLLLILFLTLRPGRSRLERIWLGCAFIGLCAVSLFRCRELLAQLLNAGLGGRYFFPLQLIVVWLLVAALIDNRPRARLFAAVALLMFAVTNFGRMREPALLDNDWPAYAAQIRDGVEVTVGTNPANWEFTVPGRGGANESSHRLTIPSGGLVNAATRVQITPERPATLSFVVRGSRPRKMLLRAVGPSLAGFGIAQPLSVPTLRLHRNMEEVRGFQPTTRGFDDHDIREATDRCGAFALQRDAGDLVALIELPAGSYSAMVSTEKQVGEVLLEVYEVPHCWYPSRASRRAKRTSGI